MENKQMHPVFDIPKAIWKYLIQSIDFSYLLIFALFCTLPMWIANPQPSFPHHTRSKKCSHTCQRLCWSWQNRYFNSNGHLYKNLTFSMDFVVLSYMNMYTFLIGRFFFLYFSGKTEGMEKYFVCIDFFIKWKDAFWCLLLHAEEDRLN